jgi:type II secretory pathway component PulJ
MVAMMVFSLISFAFLRVVFSASRGAKTVQNVVNVSEEARLSLNRMVRETRESGQISNPTATSYQLQTDFNGNGVIEATPSDPTGNYESLTFSWVEANKTLTATAGSTVEVLARGIDCVRRTTDNTCRDMFRYTSSRLEYEAALNVCNTTTSVDGVTTSIELDRSTVGNNNCLLDGSELQFVDGVEFQFTATVGKSTSAFFTTAQLRNVR